MEEVAEWYQRTERRELTLRVTTASLDYIIGHLNIYTHTAAPCEGVGWVAIRHGEEGDGTRHPRGRWPRDQWAWKLGKGRKSKRPHGYEAVGR